MLFNGTTLELDLRYWHVMDEKFLKKYWAEERILFYVHFQDGRAVRQIEAKLSGRVFLSLNCPMEGECTLYDQHLDDLQAEPKDFISAEEFERAWEKR